MVACGRGVSEIHRHSGVKRGRRCPNPERPFSIQNTPCRNPNETTAHVSRGNRRATNHFVSATALGKPSALNRTSQVKTCSAWGYAVKAVKRRPELEPTRCMELNLPRKLTLALLQNGSITIVWRLELYDVHIIDRHC